MVMAACRRNLPRSRHLLLFPYDTTLVTTVLPASFSPSTTRYILTFPWPVVPVRY